MNSPLPASVRGALCDYVVQLVERVDAADSAGEHDSTTTNPVIKIRANLPEHWRWQTLWHELLHMIEEEQNMDLTEDQVERLALGLCACWGRNQWRQPGT